MTITSNWPLPVKGIRLATPHFLLQEMRNNSLSRDLYPIATGYYPTASGHQMQRHAHHSHLLIYCAEGKGSARARNRTWRIKSGDLLLLPKGEAHEYRANKNNPWSIYWIHYDGLLSGDYTHFITADVGATAIGPQPRLIADFEALFALRHRGYSQLAAIHAANQLKQMLTSIATMVRWHQPQRGQTLDINHIQELMLKRIDRQLDLNALAAEAHLSKYHFSRKFKSLTGRSPIQYFIHLKMQHACQLLDRSSDSVKRIAGAVGFDDPYYFSRQFKHVIGLAPTQYRRNRQT